MQIEHLNQQEANAQLADQSIDLTWVPVDLIDKHLKDVENKIDDPQEIAKNIDDFINTIRDDDTYA